MARRPGSRSGGPRRDLVSRSVSSWLNFTPASLSPAAWYDASDTATITESGGAVSQWDDKSGNGRHLAQGTAAYRPTTGSTTQNGRNALSFAANKALIYAGLSVSTSVSYALVASPSSGTDDYWAGLFVSTQQWAIITKYSSISYEWFQFNNGTARFTLGDSTLAGVNALIAVKDGANVSSMVNGLPSNTSSSGGTGTLTSAELRVGAATAVGGNGVTGTLCEFIIVDRAITVAEQTALTLHLRTKWGTP